MLSQDVVVKERLFQSREATRHRERFCLLLTTDDKLVLELQHPYERPTFCEISEFPKSLATAILGVLSELGSFSFQIPEEYPSLSGRLQGKAHEEGQLVHFIWEGSPSSIYVGPSELAQLLDEINRYFPAPKELTSLLDEIRTYFPSLNLFQ